MKSKTRHNKVFTLITKPIEKVQIINNKTKYNKVSTLIPNKGNSSIPLSKIDTKSDKIKTQNGEKH